MIKLLFQPQLEGGAAGAPADSTVPMNAVGAAGAPLHGLHAKDPPAVEVQEKCAHLDPVMESAKMVNVQSQNSQRAVA